MDKPGFNREQLKQALLKLDADRVQKILGREQAPDALDANSCVAELARCGCAVVRHPDASAYKRRARVADVVHDYIKGFPEAIAALVDHLKQATLVQSSYHEILHSLKGLPISQSPVEVQVWAAVEFGSAAIRQALRQMEEQRPATGSTLGFRRPTIENETGPNVSVDGVVWGATEVVGSILAMLGYEHRWFEAATGELVIPQRVAVDLAIMNEASRLHDLSLAWQDLEKGWQRVRYFGATVERKQQDLKFANHPEPILFDVLEFGPPTHWELSDFLAVLRMEQRFVANLQRLRLLEPKAADAYKLPNDPTLGLPGPDNFISAEEAVAYEYLSDTLFLPMAEEAEHVGDLPVKAWLRGYAYVSRYCAQTRDGTPILETVILSRTQVFEGLQSVGMKREWAERFLKHTTFAKGSRDLMDEPFVRMKGDELLFFAPGYRSPVLSTIVMSRVSRFKAALSKRGERFEDAVRGLFQRLDLPVKSIAYKVDGTSYDCDAAVIWERTLILVECKNRGLPFGYLPTLSHFCEDFLGASLQVVRNITHFLADPEIVRRAFGETVVWDRVIGCVLYATPWALGRMLPGYDVYSYDASSLARFFIDGHISIEAPRTLKNGRTVTRRHRIKLWAGSQPTVQDFLRELTSPTATRIARVGRVVGANFRETSYRSGLVIPEWESEPVTAAQILETIGLAAEEAQSVVKGFQDFQAMMDLLEAQSENPEDEKRT
ncbi:MAG: hypothetical protein JWM32_3102 [Verrucomicrobia bacterium]|nr:hypothetical protein [Verrucomicrobiota bacterium]